MTQSNLQKAAFGMGCFWGPDAMFSAQKGIIHTRVGYAGGDHDAPTYRDIGDHTETVVVEFDATKVSYPELLQLFWENHHYAYSKKRDRNQYASRIFYTTEKQKSEAESSRAEKESKGKVATEIHPLNFTVAEDYHQKYRLRHSKMMANFSKMSSEEFRDSPLTAKLNGYAAGQLNLQDLEEMNLEVKPGLKDRLVSSARKWL